MPPLSSPNAPIVHPAPLAEDMRFALGKDAMRALAFREVNVKEAFTLVDSTGTFFRASLQAAAGDTGEAIAYERMRGSPESPARITLVCAVLGRQRMLVVTQKATELGCVRVVPVISELSVQPRDLEREKPWAWSGQALKAARQCRRASIPEVRKSEPLARIFDQPFWKDAHARFVLDDRAPEGVDPFPLPGERPREQDVVLAIGPEGGWSESERTTLAQRGAQPLALGTRVLRAETAVFAGVSVLQHRLGDLRVR